MGSGLKHRLLNIAIAIDQLAWVLLSFGNGHPDETLSAAAWRMESEGKWAGRILRPVIDTLLWFDRDHCRNAWLAEIYQHQLPRSYRP